MRTSDTSEEHLPTLVHSLSTPSLGHSSRHSYQAKPLHPALYLGVDSLTERGGDLEEAVNSADVERQRLSVSGHAQPHKGQDRPHLLIFHHSEVFINAEAVETHRFG